MRVLLLLLMFFWGCNTGTRERACDAAANSGCKEGQRCVIRVDGTPACLAPSGDNLGEGQLCDAEDVCGAGLGCIRVLGVDRCLRICNTADRPDLCLAAQSATTPEEADPSAPAAPFELRAAARCLVALPDRPDLGACVLPCRLGVLEDCPAQTTCTGSLALGRAVCQPVGAAALGESCSEEACEVGLVCAPLGRGRVCMAAATPCPEGTVRMELPLAASVDDAVPPAVCAPCFPVSAAEGLLGVCLGSGPVDAAPCARFGQLATLDDAQAVARAVAVTAEIRGVSVAPVWVSARRVRGQWRWADDTEIAASAWAPGEPSAGDCAALGPDGLLSAPCDDPRPALCEALE